MQNMRKRKPGPKPVLDGRILYQIGLRAPETLIDRIQRESIATHRSMGNIIGDMIEAWFAQQEKEKESKDVDEIA